MVIKEETYLITDWLARDLELISLSFFLKLTTENFFFALDSL